jgi:hypothetical protein
MRKIRLKLDALAVESFETAGAPEGAGTVQGYQLSRPGGTYEMRCAPSDGSCARALTEIDSCFAVCGCTDFYEACDNA